jgi:hypothetical protein
VSQIRIVTATIYIGFVGNLITKPSVVSQHIARNSTTTESAILASIENCTRMKMYLPTAKGLCIAPADAL